MSEANKALVRRIIAEVVNTGDFSSLDEFVSSDYRYFEPTLGSITGRDGYRKVISMYRNAFPDMTLTIDEQIAEGDTVVTRFSARGTHQGELLGIAPTGNQVSVQGITISQIRDGQLIEDHECYDVHGMMRQLGVLQAAVRAA